MAARTFAFLFSDIEGSTRLWESSSDAMTLSLQRHDRIVRAAIESSGGTVFKTVGDAFCAVFDTPGPAVDAAASIVRDLQAAEWDDRTGRLKVRLGVHVGAAEARDGDYFGATLNRTARLMSAGYGDQILLSEACVSQLSLASVSVRDLGEHRLKDLSGIERIFQLLGPGLPADFPALRTLDVRRTNLPVATSELLGRERELRIARELMRTSALLSVVGPGGVGKTRFALELCGESSDAFPDGVWFVDFSGIESGVLVASSVAYALGISERVGETLTRTIADYVRDKRILFLLDNCEHVVDDAARLVSAIVAVAREVRFVATTRDVLAIRAEQLLRLEPLAVPEPGDPPERQFSSPSVRLFIERARAVRPDLDITGEALATIADICRRLDGIPLAIELGAARTALLDVAEFPRRMDDLLRLLAQKRRDVAPRQQTLEALLDWSYRLLGDRDRAAFERLGVFTGRFDIAAAADVCAWGTLDAFDFEDALESLVQKSFVAVDGSATGSGRRLRLYETIRQFAERRSSAHPEDAETTVCRHVAHYAGVAQSSTAELSEDLAAFRDDLSNVRTAFRRACGRPALADLGATLGLAIGRYSLETGAFAEGTAALETARELPGLDATTCGWIDFILAQLAWRRQRHDDARRRYEAVAASKLDALAGRPEWGLAVLARSVGRLDEAKTLVDSSIAVLEPFGATFGLFQSYNERCGVELARGDAAAARVSAERALDVASELGHERARATALGNLATLTFYAGDLDVAARLIGDALAATERIGARLSATYFCCVRAEIALFRGEADAEAHALTALGLAVEADWTALAARAAETLAAVSGASGDAQRTETLMAWAQAARVAEGIRLDDDDRAVLERKRGLARSRSPEANQASATPARMSLDALLEFARKVVRA